MSAATILTLVNGHGIDLLDPRAADVDFAAYAEHLAKEKRYNGATPDVEYSVAEHLVRGCEAILDHTGDRLLAAYFSLHDAPEAVLKDDTTPKKRAIAEECERQFGILAAHVLAAMRDIEARHDIAVHGAARLPWPPPETLAHQVKQWDLVMFVTEWRDLMPGVAHPNWAPYCGIAALAQPIVKPWPWQVAAARLGETWQSLLPALMDEAA